MYVITGATGNSGGRIAEALLAAGQSVRAISRSAERLASLAARGADPCVCSLEDTEALTQALMGADAVYAMIPPDYRAESYRAYQNQVAGSLAAAVRSAEVPYVVALSSVGAHLAGRVGPITGLHDFEQHLNEIPGAHVLHLRPSFFMENFLFQIEMIRRVGAAGSPLREDLAMPMVAIRDTAAAAAERLLQLDFSGKSAQELLGQRDLTFPEAVGVLGKAIGREALAYVRFSYDDFAKSMRNAGFGDDAAASMIELYQALNDGLVRPAGPRTPENTTPTSIEDFARVFATVYNQGKA